MSVYPVSLDESLREDYLLGFPKSFTPQYRVGAREAFLSKARLKEESQKSM
jgi:hypothetical protein